MAELTRPPGRGGGGAGDGTWDRCATTGGGGRHGHGVVVSPPGEGWPQGGY